MFPSILIADDEPSILQSLGGLLTDEGFEVLTADNGYEALKIIDAEAPDLVILDIWMPGIDGIETLKEIKKAHPVLPVIIITGHGNVETAVKATKLGAFDLIEKPLNIDKIIVAINNALNFRRLEEENRYLRKKIIERHSINGNSKPVQALKMQIATVAPTDSWVLIKGENGTGKELVARTLHQLSPRAESPMVNVNCAAVPESLIESELFGHEKGAVPGSSARKRGKFELANTGTIFLDEIGDMNLSTQAKLLRILDEKKYQRVGGGRELTSDVRVIAATNKDLELEINNGNFREDLYYRLNVVPIDVPPLRDRTDDIPILVETFLAEAAASNREKQKTIADDAMDIFKKYTWPGNVRELKNLIERLVIMVQHDTITRKDLPANLLETKHTGSALFSIDSFDQARIAFEAEYVRKKLAAHDADIEKTADAIGVKPAYIQSLLDGKAE
ncbi:two component system response regulator, sigma54-specific [Desulfosarcina variabilis str. Montpellier]|uniref:sigma-54-dependent transcriptional regulator n=1 Tax=Desulfosarcina variabilis TaxID=2300 RepID=UPI003AFA8EA9